MSRNYLFDKCIEVILRNEGGYVNDIHDRGGATNYGISLLFLKGLKGKDFNGDGFSDGDINKDGKIDILDSKQLTKNKAVSLYKRYFWNNKYNDLDEEDLALHLFDMGVNAGTYRAVKILQRIIDVRPDGIFGNKTLSAANDVIGCSELYRIARKDYYKMLVSQNPEYEKFIKGWLNRVDKTEI